MYRQYADKHPDLAAQFKRAVLDGELPEGWQECLPEVQEHDKAFASRQHSHACLNAIVQPFLSSLVVLPISDHPTLL
jgi:transketolase